MHCDVRDMGSKMLDLQPHLGPMLNVNFDSLMHLPNLLIVDGVADVKSGILKVQAPASLVSPRVALPVGAGAARDALLPDRPPWAVDPW